jgi:YVTN family beta-propeller protein
MILNYLQHLDNQERGVVVNSSPLVIPQDLSPNTPVASTNCTIFKNGINSGSSTTISASDTITLQVTASSSYEDTVQALLVAASVGWVFQVTTRLDHTVYAKQEFLDVGPFDAVSFPDLTPYIPRDDVNSIEVIATSTGTVLNTLQVKRPTITSSIFGKDLVVVTDKETDTVLYVDPTSRAIVDYVQLPEGTAPVAGTFFKDADTQEVFSLIAAFGSNKVLVLSNATKATVSEISVGANPVAIVVDHSDNTFWVLNYGDATVSKIVGQTISIYGVGVGPYDACLDSYGNLWVASSKDNRVHVINKTSGVITPITVGANPWAIRVRNNNCYVLNSWDGTITKIDVASKAILSTNWICAYPSAMEIDTVGNLWVASYADSTVLKIVNDVVTQTIDVARAPMGLSIDELNNLWVASFYGGAPVRTYSYDYIPDRVAFLGLIDASPSIDYTSNPVTISGLRVGAVITCSIPAIANAYIKKNSVNVGWSTTITNGDILEIVQRANSSYGSNQTIRLAYGEFTADYSVTTLTEDVTPDQITFTDIANATPSTVYTSNAATISGLTAGSSLSISTSAGSFVKNSIPTGSATISVTNGDSIAIQLTASSSNDVLTTAVVTLGNIFEQWSILTASLATDHATGSIPGISNINGAPLDSLVQTTYHIAGIIDPTPDPEHPEIPVVPNTAVFRIDNLPGFGLTVNDTPVGTSAVVKNNDVVIIQVRSAKEHAIDMSHTAFLNQHPLVFHVITSPDVQPDQVIFQDVMESFPYSDYTSNEVEISGLSPGVTIPLTIPRGYFIVNNVERHVLSTQVTNGDLVKWVTNPGPPYSGNTSVTMNLNGITATWKFYNIALDGPTLDKIDRSYRDATNLSAWLRSTSFSAEDMLPTTVVKEAVKTSVLTKSANIKSSLLSAFQATAPKVVEHRFAMEVARGTAITQAVPTRIANPIAYTKEIAQTKLQLPNTFVKEVPISTELINFPPMYGFFKSDFGPVLTYSAPWSKHIELKPYVQKVPFLRHEPSKTIANFVFEKESYVMAELLAMNWERELSIKAEAFPKLPEAETVISNRVPDVAPSTNRNTQANKVTVAPIAYRTIASDKIGVQPSPIRNTNGERTTSAVTYSRETVSTNVGQALSVVVEGIKAVKVPMTFTFNKLPVKGDPGYGIANIYRTRRFATPLQAQLNAEALHFTNIQTVAWGDGTFIWTGDCTTYHPYAIAGYISGG